MTVFPVWFYNVRVGRSSGQVDTEVRAILSQRPAVLGLCEVVGYRLSQVEGYELIRDTSTPGRANIAAYVRCDFPVRGVRWTRCRTTWKRPKGPGRHWPREILSFRAAKVQVVVGHQLPRWVDTEYQGQREGLRKTARLMAPWKTPRWDDMNRKQRRRARQRPRIAIKDWNRTARDSGPGPAKLARRIGGHVKPGNRIDAAVYRGQLRVRGFARPSTVAGVRLKSDHPHALRLDVRVPRKWIERG